MLSQVVTISNKLGLHARAAAKLVTTAGRYTSETQLTLKQKTVNAKSIMGVMLLAASKGSEITVTAKGPDEAAALTAVVDLINDRFGEAE